MRQMSLNVIGSPETLDKVLVRPLSASGIRVARQDWLCNRLFSEAICELVTSVQPVKESLPLSLSPIGQVDPIRIHNIAQSHDALQLMHVGTARYRQGINLV